MRFKVGDRVRVKEFENDGSLDYAIGNEYTIDEVNGASQFPYALAGCCFKECELELVVKGNEDMNIEIKYFEDDDGWEYRQGVRITIDGDNVLDVMDGEIEDNNLSRNFSDIYNIKDIIEKVYNAGLNNQELVLKVEELPWDKYWSD